LLLDENALPSTFGGRAGDRGSNTKHQTPNTKQNKMSNRLSVLKTYKIYINGQFPRTESGRYYVPTNAKGQWLANVCLSSKKDVKEAVVAARAATAAWHERPAFNRGQILYRIAEMLEGRKAQFIEELMQQGSKKPAAEKEVLTAIDRLIYYSGWCDKYQQIFTKCRVRPDLLCLYRGNFSGLDIYISCAVFCLKTFY
jgi:delta 1-pyrroline-5-carboxylate dehydrogenase